MRRIKNSESPAEFNLELTSMITDQKNGTGHNSRPDVMVERVEPPKLTIPADINSRDRLQAAEYYHGILGWAVHPLNAPNRGQENERGKKPLTKGWPSHTAAEVTPGYLNEHFGATTNNNLGVVVRAPFICVDLDSKPNAGESVRTWFAEQPHLANVPREHTGGGAHLHFRCHDLPEGVTKQNKAITVLVNTKVTAELYCDVMNIVVSPSVHKSGTKYSWEVTGEIPAATWAELQRWFGFKEPKKPKRGRHRLLDPRLGMRHEAQCIHRPHRPLLAVTTPSPAARSPVFRLPVPINSGSPPRQRSSARPSSSAAPRSPSPSLLVTRGRLARLQPRPWCRPARLAFPHG